VLRVGREVFDEVRLGEDPDEKIMVGNDGQTADLVLEECSHRVTAGAAPMKRRRVTDRRCGTR
jgi:hypothetical protein